MKRGRQQAFKGLENEVAELKSRLATVESENASLWSALGQAKADYNGVVSGKGLSEEQVGQICASIANWISDEEKSPGASIGEDSEAKEEDDHNILLRMLHNNVVDYLSAVKKGHEAIKRVIEAF